jgi:hypothetical protein
MNKLIALTAVLVATVAAAQDSGQYNRGLTAFNSGDYDTSVQVFYELAENSSEAETRQKAEYYLAQSLVRKGLPVSAFIYYGTILKQGKNHPNYLKAVEGLVNVQQQLEDEYLIPNVLNKDFNDTWATLPPETMARINYLIGGISQRRGKLEEARSFLEAVPATSPVYPKARYLLGVVLADLSFPGGPKFKEAVNAFTQVLNTRLAKGASPQAQTDLEETQQLANLGLGRVHYGTEAYADSTAAYERIPRFSKFWDQALFENGFARYRNDDYGGALGSLQALHAPQFAGAFQPESWVLKATAYYFSCLYDEANTALKSYDDLYLPMGEALKKWVGDDKDLNAYFKAVNDEGSTALPRPVVLWVRGNERLQGIFRVLAQIDKEKSAIRENGHWRGGKIQADLNSALDQNKNTLIQVGGQLAKNRLQEAARNIKSFSDQAEIIRFENSKAEKELAEAGVDQRTLLAQKRVFRPKMPAEDWNYWRFQGEFWIDEIGYYQYTLKNGCPASSEE